MTDEYNRAMRNIMSERRALWAVLVDLLAEKFRADPRGEKALADMLDQVMERLDRKEVDAERKGLEIGLADWRAATDRFFVDIKKCMSEGQG